MEICHYQSLTEHEIITKIQKRELFSATIDSQAFSIKIAKYQPTLAAAIHNGDQLREELTDNCLLNKSQRYYEEDPFTGSFISDQPITLIAHDSRYEYDLNRAPDACVYETAWGVDVWKNALTEEQKTHSEDKHAQFYRIVAAIVEALQADFGQCIVYDNHSYNYKRHERKDLPVINIGTTSVKSEKWRPVIDSWLTTLTNMKVDGVEVTVAENDIFYGKGYLAAFCHTGYDNVLVLATESKKVFMDELTGEADERVLPSLQKAYNESVAKHSQYYIDTLLEKL